MVFRRHQGDMAPAAIVMSFGSGQIAAQIASDEAMGRSVENLTKVVVGMGKFSHNMSDYQRLRLEIMTVF